MNRITIVSSSGKFIPSDFYSQLGDDYSEGDMVGIGQFGYGCGEGSPEKAKVISKTGNGIGWIKGKERHWLLLVIQEN
jgi:hypothetical protein